MMIHKGKTTSKAIQETMRRNNKSETQKSFLVFKKRKDKKEKESLVKFLAFYTKPLKQYSIFFPSSCTWENSSVMP